MISTQAVTVFGGVSAWFIGSSNAAVPRNMPVFLGKARPSHNRRDCGIHPAASGIAGAARFAYLSDRNRDGDDCPCVRIGL
jgi:hypothetical protein